MNYTHGHNPTGNLKHSKLNFMKTFIFLLIGALVSNCEAFAQITIIFRGDDMGFSHSANEACIDTYVNGLVRSVEVIVPGPWFEEAVQMLEKNPGLDVGVHLALTSEWRFLKWKPLTNSPSLVDDNGYFYPIIWPSENRPGAALKDHEWKLEEVEQELRAQIELAIKRIPHVTHFTGHMGCTHMSEEVTTLAGKLAKEYGIEIFPEDHGYGRLPQWTGKEYNFEQKKERLKKVLKELKPGKYLSVTHPAYNSPESRSIHHPGYENVSEDRDAETKVLTDPEIKDLVSELGIEIIGYDEVK
ncbi:MAG: carbohydrate deacetylase [Cyclobacteriaceae bacterium]|nr:MAG: carbohydrate deacetylase [Cyclobacteriaceae bacterium]